MRRRIWVVAVIACVAGALLTGASLAARAAGSADEVNLTMWWWGEQEATGAKKWLAETVKLYEKKYPGVTVKTVLQTTDGLIPVVQGGRSGEEGPGPPVLLGRDLVARRCLGRQHETGLRLHPAGQSSGTT